MHRLEFDDSGCASKNRSNDRRSAWARRPSVHFVVGFDTCGYTRRNAASSAMSLSPASAKPCSLSPGEDLEPNVIAIVLTGRRNTRHAARLQVLRLPNALSSHQEVDIQQNRNRQRQPRHDIPPSIADKRRKKADDAQHADDGRGSKDLSKRSMVSHDKPSRRHERSIDRGALRDGAVDADTGLAPAQPEIDPRTQHDDRQHVEHGPEDPERQAAVIAEMQRLRQ
jgi:hypothetical protein